MVINIFDANVPNTALDLEHWINSICEQGNELIGIYGLYFIFKRNNLNFTIKDTTKAEFERLVR